MELYVAHDSTEKISCCFFTIVIRNQALVKHDNGGLKGFMEQYHARCNNNLVADCYMGGEVDDTIKDLLRNGLAIDEEFIVFDVGGYTMDLNMNPETRNRSCNIDMGVAWLKARYIPGDGFYVWYAAKD